jgi:hypothetical protein
MRILHNIVSSARVRLAAARFARAVLRNAIVALLILIVTGVIAVRAGRPAWNAPFAAMLGSFFAIFAVVEGILRVPARVTSALVLDKALKTHELFATALDVEQVQGDIPAEIRGRAESAARECDVNAAVPVRIHPLLIAVPVILAAALLVVISESGATPDETAALIAKKLDSAAVQLSASGRGSDEEIAAAIREAVEALKKGSVGADRVEEIRRAVRVRIRSSQAILDAIRELEKLGMKDVRGSVEKGDPRAASAAAASALESGLDEDAVREQVAHLFDSIRDGDLRRKLSGLDGVEDLPKLAELLAEYVGAADTAALEEVGRNLDAAASKAEPSAAPGEVAAGPSAEIDIESIPLRYRTVVVRYFSP